MDLSETTGCTLRWWQSLCLVKMTGTHSSHTHITGLCALELAGAHSSAHLQEAFLGLTPEDSPRPTVDSM